MVHVDHHSKLAYRLRRPISLITIDHRRRMNTRDRHRLTILITVSPSGAIHARNRHLLTINRRRSPRPWFPPLQLHPPKCILPFHQLGGAPRAGDFKLQNKSADEDRKHVSDGYDGGVQQTDERKSCKNHNAEDDVYGSHDRSQPIQRHRQDLRRRILQRLILLIRAKDEFRPQPTEEPSRQRIPPSQVIRLLRQLDAPHDGRVIERPRGKQMNDAG